MLRKRKSRGNSKRNGKKKKNDAKVKNLRISKHLGRCENSLNVLHSAESCLQSTKDLLSEATTGTTRFENLSITLGQNLKDVTRYQIAHETNVSTSPEDSG
jgi:hypothetical protein